MKEYFGELHEFTGLIKTDIINRNDFMENFRKIRDHWQKLKKNKIFLVLFDSKFPAMAEALIEKRRKLREFDELLQNTKLTDDDEIIGTFIEKFNVFNDILNYPEIRDQKIYTEETWYLILEFLIIKLYKKGRGR
jgi:hypothetical protein